MITVPRVTLSSGLLVFEVVGLHCSGTSFTLVYLLIHLRTLLFTAEMIFLQTDELGRSLVEFDVV